MTKVELGLLLELREFVLNVGAMSIYTQGVRRTQLLKDIDATLEESSDETKEEPEAKHESIPNGWAVVPREADDVIAASIPHGNGPQGRDFYRRLVAIAELSGGAHLRVRHWSCNIEARGERRCAEWCRLPDQCPGSAEVMHRPAVKTNEPRDVGVPMDKREHQPVKCLVADCPEPPADGLAMCAEHMQRIEP